MSATGWALVFMMLILKIPIVYLGCVVWYAIKAEPEPGVEPQEEHRSGARGRRPNGPRPRRGGPHGSRDRARVQQARRDRVGP